jgi:hypothetical protein
MQDDDLIIVKQQAGWPIVVKQELIFSDLSDSQFRIVCAYLARDEDNNEAFEELVANYNPEGVADMVRWVEQIGLTRNG